MFIVALTIYKGPKVELTDINRKIKCAAYTDWDNTQHP